MRQWKIALSLAIVGAAAAPFIFGTWRMRPMSNGFIPLTAGERQNILSYVENTDNCQKTASDSVKYSCLGLQRELADGGEFRTYASAPKYIAWNTAAAALGFSAVFGLTFLLPALIRRYWKWINA
jgi:hypothetical protein